MPSEQKSANSCSGYVLDTNIISALVPDRRIHLPAQFADWLQAHHDKLFVPCIAFAEIAQGVAKLRRAGGVERAARLDSWLDGLLNGFPGRILVLDAASARLAGQLSDAAVARGQRPGFADVAIAALAMHNGFLLLTRNLKHFEPLGVVCEDPLALQSDSLVAPSPPTRK